MKAQDNELLNNTKAALEEDIRRLMRNANANACVKPGSPERKVQSTMPFCNFGHDHLSC